ncbi:MAG: aldo/keto reductase [Balneolaceae bacterium]
MQVKTVRGVDVPEIGIGTNKLIGRECRQVIQRAVETGYRHIDTAQMYQNEREIGQAINSSTIPREEIFLTTKVWHTDLAHDDLLQSVEDSLRELDTPYVDLLLVHWPNPQISLERTFEAMMTLRDQGKALNIGVSNFTPSLIRETVEEIGVPLFCNQLEFHPFLDQLEMLELSYQHDFLVTAHTPLCQGKVAESETLVRIGKAYGKSATQVALRWLIEQENVAAIPKTSDPVRLKENLDIFDFELSDAHFEEIGQLATGRRVVNPVFAPDWD